MLGLVLERLPATLLLTGAAFTISLGIGVSLGMLAARNFGKLTDSIITTLALVFYATPLFWIALMSQIVFALKLGLLPNVGYETIGAGYTGFARAVDIGKHLILPALTLGLFFTALYARMMRASMLEIAGADFVKTASAKGLRPSVVLRRHVARNAMLPVVTLAGLQAGQLVGGAVLTETVFAWPGMGRLLFDALVQRDYSVLLGVFFVSSAMVVVFNIITDLAVPYRRPPDRGSVMGFLKRFARNRGAVIGLALLSHPWSLFRAHRRLIARIPQSPWRVVGRPFVAPVHARAPPARHRHARPRHRSRSRPWRAGLADDRRGVDAGGAADRRAARRRRRLCRAARRRSPDALHRVFPDHPELRARHRAGRDPATSLSSIVLAIGSCRGRPWRASSAAKCCH